MRKKFDFIVCGGGLAACLFAITAARSGRSVAIVESRGFLGHEVTASLRPWDLKSPKSGGYDGVLQELVDILGKSGQELAENAELKKDLLQWLDNCGVEVYFSMQACALLLDKSNQYIGGVLLGGKWGYYLLEGTCVVDAEQSMPLFRMLSDAAWQHDSTATAVLRCRADGAEAGLPDRDALRQIGAEQYGSDDKPYFAFSYPISEYDDAGTVSLKGQETAFLGLKLLKKTYPQAKLEPLQMGDEPLIKSDMRVEKSQQVRNLFYINLGWKIYEGLEKMVRAIPEILSGCCDAECKAAHFVNRNCSIPLDSCVLQEYKPYEADLPLQKICLPDLSALPVLDEFDVIVAGGGTSGVPAAVAAARCGAKTMVAEACFGFGGTQSYGLVGGYYFGYVDGFADLQKANMDRHGVGISPVGRMLWYQHSMREEGVALWCGTGICGVEKQADTLTGIVTVRDGVWGTVRSKVVVDATGDGDLIDFAGVDWVLGSAKDGNLQNSSQWNVSGVRGDLDTFYQSEYSEVLRGIRMTHRLCRGGDFSVLLTPREGRTFCGEYTLNMQDIILQRTFPDAIAVGSTDNDPHGGMSSTLYLMGMTPYHDATYTVAVPYRSCIPKGIRGLLAASKSIGATQDAASYLRMAADIQNRGYALGTAAGLAVREKCDVRDIPLAELQEILVHMQILPRKMINTYKEPGMDELLKLMQADERQGMEKILCMPQEIALPALKRAFQNQPDSLPVGIALGWFGERESLPLLEKCLHQLVAAEEIDKFDDRHPRKAGNNMGGIMGAVSDYWRINQILTVFALVKEKCAVNDVVKLLEDFTAGGSPVRDANAYVSGRVDLHRIPHYDRMRCLAYYIKNVPAAEYKKPLEALLDKEFMHGYFSDGTNRTSGANYQSAYLELQIGECLARCGSEAGVALLKKGLADGHYVIRRKSYLVLQDVDGKTADCALLPDECCIVY